MAVRPERRLTYDDYVHFPESERWELVDGEALVVPAPNARHQRLIGRLFNEIYNYLERHGGGEVFVSPFDVVLSDFDVFQPDIVFIADQDRQVLNEKNVRGSPTWAIEVLSPSTASRDTEMKLQRYEKFRVPEYWIVDPWGNNLTIYVLEEARYPSPVLEAPPGLARPRLPASFEIDLTHLFRD
ncbi:MAG: Uma2 family endonuclease [Actinomycetota bacterium]